jgi:hypothetical protein
LDRNDAASAAALAAPIRETGYPIVVSGNNGGCGLTVRLSTEKERDDPMWSSDELERDLSAIIGEDLRVQAEKAKFEQAKEEALSVERLKQTQFEQQVQAERHVERGRLMQELQVAEQNQLVQMQSEFRHAERQRETMIHEAMTATESAFCAREQALLGEYLHTIQNAVVEGENRRVQAEVLVSAEAERLHEVHLERFEYEARMQHNAHVAELEQSAEAHHAAALAAERQRFDAVLPEAILAERNKIEKQALEILNSERHKLRETLSAE